MKSVRIMLSLLTALMLLAGWTVCHADETNLKDGGNTMYIQAGDTVFSATLADNSSAAALKKLLGNGPVTVDMRDYANMEKVGGLGTTLPRNDEAITTAAGDLILYQGNMLVIYYAPNSWSFTRLGKIENATAEELLNALGEGDVTVTLSLEKPVSGTPVILEMNGTEVKATLNDTELAKAFLELLPYQVTVSRAADDLCGSVSEELPSNENEVRQGWKTGEIGWFGGWFTILCDHEEQFASGSFPIIGKVDPDDLAFVTSLTGRVEITVCLPE